MEKAQNYLKKSMIHNLWIIGVIYYIWQLVFQDACLVALLIAPILTMIAGVSGNTFNEYNEHPIGPISVSVSAISLSLLGVIWPIIDPTRMPDLSPSEIPSSAIIVSGVIVLLVNACLIGRNFINLVEPQKIDKNNWSLGILNRFDIGDLFGNIVIHLLLQLAVLVLLSYLRFSF